MTDNISGCVTDGKEIHVIVCPPMVILQGSDSQHKHTCLALCTMTIATAEQ